MTQIELKGKPKAAMLANVQALLEAGERLRNRSDHLPGLGLFYGPSGFGKSVAATVLATTTNAAYVEAKSSWTRRAFLEAVAVELGVKPEKTLHKTAELVGEELGSSQRMLIVDEVDFLLDKGIIEQVRELHMTSLAPIMMIGEEIAAAKLRRFERVDNRVLVHLPAQPAGMSDARALAGMFCRQVHVADDLLAILVQATKGRVRRIVVNLDRIQDEAARHGVELVDKAWWGDREIFTGQAPARKVQ